MKARWSWSLFPLLLLASPLGAAERPAQAAALGGEGAAGVATYGAHPDLAAIDVNPAAVGLVRQYTVGLYYRRTGALGTLGAAVVDSTRPLAAGVAYRYRPRGTVATLGGWQHRLTVALAEFYRGRWFTGLQYRYRWGVTGDGTRRSAHNLGLGVIVPLAEWLRFGIAGRDLAPWWQERPDSRVVLGLAGTFLDLVTVTADGIWHTAEDPQAWEGVAGVEAILLGEVALRGGWRRRFDRRGQVWSAGVGWYFPRGQVAYAYGSDGVHTLALEVDPF